MEYEFITEVTEDNIKDEVVLMQDGKPVFGYIYELHGDEEVFVVFDHNPKNAYSILIKNLIWREDYEQAENEAY